MQCALHPAPCFPTMNDLPTPWVLPIPSIAALSYLWPVHLEARSCSLAGDPSWLGRSRSGPRSPSIVGANLAVANTPDLPQPDLHELVASTPALPHVDELAAKPPQRPVTPPQAPEPVSPKRHRSARKPSMDYPEDPWNTPDLHRNHNHGPEPPQSNGHHDVPSPARPPNGNDFGTSPQVTIPRRTTSTFTTSVPPSGAGSVAETASPWGFLDGNPPAAGGFGEPAPSAAAAAPFGGIGGGGPTRESIGGLPAAPVPAPAPNRTIGNGRPGATVEENILVTLMPEKEGMFLFQHHNYEVTSSRRGSKVVRRYSDFVWLLDCLHKRYPFRVLPLLPPKRVAGEYTDPRACWISN